LRTECSRPTGCHDAACGGSSRRRARSLWWRNPRIKSGKTTRSWASPSCFFVLTAGLRDSIPSQSPRSTQAAASRRLYSRRQRKLRGRASADPCGLKCTKEITVLSEYIVGPDIMNSAGISVITRTAVMRSGSRSSCQMADDGRHMSDGGDSKSDTCHLTSVIRHLEGARP
jgi:hypothetical protein